MKTINVREFRNVVPHLRETLSQEHELLLVSNGQPIARILPVTQPPRLQPLKWLRDMAPPSGIPSEVLIREDRDRRSS
jgi:antitoxin (DNA-binding transcriptional repressor) of toxin-antitoxin stability system